MSITALTSTININKNSYSGDKIGFIHYMITSVSTVKLKSVKFTLSTEEEQSIIGHGFVGHYNNDLLGNFILDPNQKIFNDIDLKENKFITGYYSHYGVGPRSSEDQKYNDSIHILRSLTTTLNKPFIYKRNPVDLDDYLFLNNQRSLNIGFHKLICENDLELTLSVIFEI